MVGRAVVVVLSCECRVLDSLKRTGQISTERVGGLTVKPEATNIIHPEPDKPGVVVLVEVNICLVLQLSLHSKPLRCLAPPMGLEREDEHVLVVEGLFLFRHSKTVEPAKRMAVGRESNNRDVSLALVFLKQAAIVKGSTVLS